MPFAQLIVAAMLLGHPRAAHGQAPAPSVNSPMDRAMKLKALGDALMLKGDYEGAVTPYVEAYAINADPALLYNTGRAFEALGDYPSALGMFEQFSRAASPDLRARVPRLDALLADVRARVATLTITGPDRAELFVRGKALGKLPLGAPLRLRAGPADVEVRAEGYETFRKALVLTGNEATLVTVALLRAIPEGMGAVTVATNPPGAAVIIDDVPHGASPVATTVSLGSHRIVARMSGFEDVSTTIQVSNGERREVDLGMSNARPITSRWWFWGGVGVLVVAGAVVTILVATPAEAPSGSIPPGQVRSPLRVAF